MVLIEGEFSSWSIHLQFLEFLLVSLVELLLSVIFLGGVLQRLKLTTFITLPRRLIECYYSETYYGGKPDSWWLEGSLSYHFLYQIIINSRFISYITNVFILHIMSNR